MATGREGFEGMKTVFFFINIRKLPVEVSNQVSHLRFTFIFFENDPNNERPLEFKLTTS